MKIATHREAESTGSAAVPGAPPVESGPPLFIVGCGRSGTTLVRMMLNAHPEIAVPTESHFIYELARRRLSGRWSARLDDATGWSGLMRYLDQHHYLGLWKLDKERLHSRLGELSPRTHSAVFRAIFTEFMRKEGKTRWGDKTPMHVQYMLMIERLFPDARFLHVVRDGRDVALSLLTRTWGPRSMRTAGLYWKWLVLSGAVAGSILGPERYREVRYEDLVTDPESTLRQLCDWLQVEYDPQMLDFHRTRAAAEYAAGGIVARRLKEPVDQQRLRIWQREMSRADQRSILRQAGGLLEHYGYPVEEASRRQRRDTARIRRLLAPETAGEIDRGFPQPGGSDLRIRAGAFFAGMLQPIHFLSRRYVAWAEAGVRKQRSLACLLR